MWVMQNAQGEVQQHVCESCWYRHSHIAFMRITRYIPRLHHLHRHPPTYTYHSRTFTMSTSTEKPFDLTTLSDTDIHQRYKHSYLEHTTPDDWVNQLDLTHITTPPNQRPVNVLILYGSLRQTSKSKLCAYEFARILHRLHTDVRVFDPQHLPFKSDSADSHPAVIELRQLSDWSDLHVWVSPEQHGAITGIFKNIIDCIPLSLGSVRPTQGKVLAVAQVNGGSQSFNTVNTLRLLGRWMRMITIPNQSSIPMAWKEFLPADQPDSRLRPSSYRDRVVDVAEEAYKFAVLLRPHSAYLADRYSERMEKMANGRLMSQAEKEAQKDKDKQAASNAHAAHADTAVESSSENGSGGSKK